MHGLAAWLQNHVSLEALSQDTQLRVRSQFQAVAAKGLRTKKLLEKTLDALAKKDVVPVLLKGFGLASRLYHEPLLRPSTDVDIFVSVSQLSRARQALETMGLAADSVSDAYYPEEFRQHFVYSSAGGMVELHYRLMSALGKAWEGTETQRRAVEATLEGRRVKYLRPEDELVFLSLHAANHCFHRLVWLYDVKLFLDFYPHLNWDEVIRVAQEEAQLPELLFYTLDLAHRLFSAQIPDFVWPALKPSALRVFYFRKVFSEDRLLRAEKKGWGLKKFVLANQRNKVVQWGWRRAMWAFEKKRLPAGT